MEPTPALPITAVMLATDAVAVAPAPVIPPGIPPTNPAAPKWALTQEQIDFLINTVSSFWPAFKTYWPIIVMIAAGFGVGGGLTGRYVVPATTPPVVIEQPSPIVPPSTPKGCQCGCVVTGNCACRDCDHPQLTPTPVVVPTVQPVKLTLYSTTSLDDALVIAGDLSLKKVADVTVEPRLYPAGSVYPFQGKSIPVPCVAFTNAAGKVVDVAPYASLADVMAFVQKNQGK